MSDAALRERAWRQLQASPGGRQDRVLGIARVALPMAAGVLVAVLGMAPLSQDRDISFILDKKKVAVAPERMRVERAQYRGTDDKGQPFSLTAGSGVQRSSTDPVVRLKDIAGRIQLDTGPAAITAGSGRYDLIAERIAVDGPITFKAPDGYELQTRDVTVDMKTRTMGSAGPVEGRMPLGTFTAGRLRADLPQRHVVLDGGARLKIVQGGLK